MWGCPEETGMKWGLGWNSTFGTLERKDAITSGLGVTWTTQPTKMESLFL
jgi:catalase-peroxidase